VVIVQVFRLFKEDYFEKLEDIIIRGIVDFVTENPRLGADPRG
jgi:hypothetical protein